MNGVELVCIGKNILHPEPLNNTGLEQGCGGVGIVLKKLWRPFAIICQIKPAVDGMLILFPGVNNKRNCMGGYLEPVKKILVYNMLGRLNAAFLQIVGGCL